MTLVSPLEAGAEPNFSAGCAMAQLSADAWDVLQQTANSSSEESRLYFWGEDRAGTPGRDQGVGRALAPSSCFSFSIPLHRLLLWKEKFTSGEPVPESVVTKILENGVTWKKSKMQLCRGPHLCAVKDSGAEEPLSWQPLLVMKSRGGWSLWGC